MSIVEKGVSSLSEYMAFIEEHAEPGHTLFRGQPEKDDDGKECKLLPKIAREKRVVSLDDEMARTGELERRAAYVEPLPRNEWEWMALAQHYGLSTRLLDWTRYGLAALWFAVCEQSGGWKTRPVGATVWMFTYTDADINKGEKIVPKAKLYRRIDKETKITQVLFPRLIDRRMVAQAACFTVHARCGKDSFVALDDEKRHKASLTKINILKRDCSRIRQQLDLQGINESVLFPDLDGLCSHIAYSHRVKRQSGQGSQCIGSA